MLGGNNEYRNGNTSKSSLRISNVNEGRLADEFILGIFRVGDFVAVAPHNVNTDAIHWTLGSVESTPFARDLEIRLWTKQREDFDENRVSETEEGRKLIEHILKVRTELAKSTEEAAKLTEELRAHRARIVEKTDIVANHIAESNAAAVAARNDVEKISYRHWHELKSYRLPPKMITTILRAVMLLFSQDDARDWPHMQQILRDKGFRQQILEYDPDVMLTDERREYILRECVSSKNFRYDCAVKGSQAMGPIYYWTLAQLDRSEANRSKRHVEKERANCAEELQSVMKEIHEQHLRMGEYQSMMDKLDDQLNAYCMKELERHTSKPFLDKAPETAWDRYERSFARAENKKYLLAAYYVWKPTDRIIFVLRRNILANYKGLDDSAWNEGYLLNEKQIRELDNALIMRQRDMDNLRNNEAERLRRQQDEEKEIEKGMFQTASGEDEQDTYVDIFYRTFNGNNWNNVLAQKRDVFLDTFCDETAEMLQIPRSSVYVLNLSAREATEGLQVAAQIRHVGTKAKEVIQTAVEQYPYPRIHSLYDSEKPHVEKEDIFRPVEHQMFFKGQSWKSILQKHKAEVTQAFVNDTSEALGVANKTDICVITAKYDDGLKILYTLQEPIPGDDKIESIVNTYEYPELWDLYNNTQTPKNGNKKFDGDNWEAVQEAKSAALEEAFRGDTADALGLPAKNVAVRAMRATEDALVVSYAVQDGERSGAEIESAVKEYPYPGVWELYEEAPAEVEDYVQTHHRVAYEGVDWDYVLRVKKDLVHQAFVNSTVAPFELTEKHVSNAVMRYEDGGLKVDFDLSHPASMLEAYIMKQLKMCDYSAVWALYEARPYDEAEKVVSAHKLGFDGKDWSYVMEKRRPDVEEAVAAGTASALQVEHRDVRDVDLDVTPDGLLVSLKVRHTPLLGDAQIKSELADYPYDELWNLYEVRPTEEKKEVVPRESSVLTRKFDGEDWDLVLRNRARLLEAFQKDTADALAVSPIQVVVLDARIGSLIVDFKVLGCDMEDDEIVKHIDTYGYPEVHALYVPRVYGMGYGCYGVDQLRHIDVDKNLMTTEHTKAFDGDNWEAVQEAKSAALEEAFRGDTADALGLPAKNVAVRAMRATEDALVVIYAVQDGERSGAEIESAVKEYPYPGVWELYEEAPAEVEDYVQTHHRVAYEGVDWDYVLRVKKDLVHQAFVNSTVAPFELTEKHVSNAVMRYEDGGLKVDFDLSHPTSMSEAYIMKQLKMCDYSAVWALYEARPYDEAEKVVSAHKLGFDGKDWSYVMEKRRPDVEEAVAAGTASALQVEHRDVRDVDLDVTPDGLLVSLKVRHTPLLGDAQIKSELADYPYDELWNLYEVRPTEEKKEVVPRESSVLTRKFDGEDWDLVLRNRARLLEAFQKDTADALAVSPIQVVVLDARIGSLIVDFKVLGCDMEDDEIVKHIDTYGYPEVHALYVPRVYGMGYGCYGVDQLRHIDVDKNLMTTEHTKAFDGDNWEAVQEAKSAALEEAFRGDTADALGLPAKNVAVRAMRATEDALVVSYAVQDGERSGAEIESAVKEYPYPGVWELYEEAPAEVEDYVQTHHRVAYEGVDWDYVLRVKKDLVHQAFVNSTVAPFELTEKHVSNAVMRYEDGGLKVDFDLSHPASMLEAYIMKQLKMCDYSAVWALYEARPYDEAEKVVSAHKLGFDGKDWSYVMEKRRPDVEEAVAAGTASALQVEHRDVRDVDLDVTPDGLLVSLKVRHTPLLGDAQIKSELADYPYDELWNLYEVRPTEEKKEVVPRESSVLTRKFDGEDWDLVLRNRARLLESFQKDTADALAVSPSQVVVLDVRIGSLIVDFKVLGCDMEDDEIVKHIDTYGYPEVHALYVPRVYGMGYGCYGVDQLRHIDVDKNLMTTEHTKAFDGDNWEAVQEAKSAALEEAFRADTADALGLPAKNVAVRAMRATEDALVVSYAVQDGERSGAEIESAVKEYPYLGVWELYEEAPAEVEDYVQTHHRVAYEGVDWDYVLRVKKDLVHQAFVNSTVAPFELTEKHVSNAVMRYEDEGLKVDFDLSHPASMSEAYIMKQLKMCDYSAVWALYEARPYDEAEKVVSAHKLGFDGKDWSYVMEKRRPDVEEAVAAGTASALQVEHRDVRDVDLDVTPDGLLVSLKVRHTPLLGDAQIKSELADYPYDELWNLYEVRPTEEKKEVVPRESSVLTRKFNAESRDLRVLGSRAKLLEAFQKDTADALAVSPSQVVVVDARIGSLVVDFKVLGCDMEDHKIVKHTDTYGYPEVHALYVPRVLETSNVDVHVVVGKSEILGSVSSQLRKCDVSVTFDGDHWKYVLEKKRYKVCMAFVEETAKAVGVDVSAVEVLELETGGLMVKCSVIFPQSLSEQEVRTRVMFCEYREVWKLYEPWPFDVNLNKDRISHHVVVFEDTDWDFTLSVRREDVDLAFLTGTCLACGINEKNVLNLSFNVSPFAMTVDFDIVRPASLSSDAVDSFLMRYPYAEVWGLHTRPKPE